MTATPPDPRSAGGMYVVSVEIRPEVLEYGNLGGTMMDVVMRQIICRVEGELRRCRFVTPPETYRPYPAPPFFNGEGPQR